MYAHRFHGGHWSFLGPGLEKTWYETRSDKPNTVWEKTAAAMMLHMSTESRHPFFRASSVSESGQLDIKEDGKKSTRFDDNEGNIEMLLRAVISVNQLNIYRILAENCKKNSDKNSSPESAPSSDESESSGTLYAKEILGVFVMPENNKMLTWRKPNNL